jgi:hypothetical protein
VAVVCCDLISNGVLKSTQTAEAAERRLPPSPRSEVGACIAVGERAV